MSIKKKLELLVVAQIVIPIFLLLIVSTYVFGGQIASAEKQYLATAMKIVCGEMDGRKNEMEKASRFLTERSDFQAALRRQDRKVLQRAIGELKKNYSYLDLVMIVNMKNHFLAGISPEIQYNNQNLIETLVKQSLIQKEVIVSNEVVPLATLFEPQSVDYQNFSVRINEDAGKEAYLRKALIGLVIVPIYDTDDQQTILGAIVVGDVFNNDNFFPEYYSKRVKNSFLAISVDGIRVASNIETGTGKSLIGSKAPINTQENSSNNDLQYFDRIQIDEEMHVFLDVNLTNYVGERIAVLGVGVPETKFSGIISKNYKIFMVTTAVCLILMLFIGRHMANRISRPIIEVTNLAQAYSRREFQHNSLFNNSSKDEGSILLETFIEFTAHLKIRDEERKVYLSELKMEHEKQKELSVQLMKWNDKLETVVNERTEHLQQAIADLKKADVVKSHFVANISHELRTPLNAIIGSSEVLSEDLLGGLNEKQKKYIRNIYTSGVHLLHLINDILDISKIAVGKMNLNLCDFYIAELIAQTVENVKSYVQEKRLHISVSITPSDFCIYADPHKLKQILYNLLSNAVKFTESNGEISIEVLKREIFMEVIISDNGIGIAVQDIDRVFMEFEQVDTSYSKRYDGTGLGLPLVKKLVEMHGGQVHLNSKLGVGSKIIFTIPLHTENFLNDEYNKARW